MSIFSSVYRERKTLHDPISLIFVGVCVWGNLSAGTGEKRSSWVYGSEGRDESTPSEGRARG